MYEGKHAAPPENQPIVCLLRHTWKQAMTGVKGVDIKDCDKHLAARVNVTVL